jgi:branched-chain amino acid transport system permease protein
MLVTPSRRLAIAIAIAFLLQALVPLFADTFLLKLATRIVVLSIFVMSLDLLIGFTGLVSFGHAAFFGLAAYSLQIASPEYESVNAFWALPLCLAVTALAATVIGALVVRTKGIYFIMVTLAFAQMLFFFFHDSKIAGGSDGAFIFSKPIFSIFGFALISFEDRITFYYFALCCLAASYILLVIILRSPFGQVIQGIRVNEHRMIALGYNTYLFKLVSFVIAGTMAGLAGFLFASIDGFVSPELLAWTQSGSALVKVILGGMGTLFGPILGTYAFVIAEEVFKDEGLVGGMAEHWQILMGAFVIAVVIFLPNGLGGALIKLTGTKSDRAPNHDAEAEHHA